MTQLLEKAFATAAQLPGAPLQKLSPIAESIFSKSAGSAQGEQFLRFMYATSENPEVRRYLNNKFKVESPGAPRKIH